MIVRGRGGTPPLMRGGSSIPLLVTQSQRTVQQRVPVSPGGSASSWVSPSAGVRTSNGTAELEGSEDVPALGKRVRRRDGDRSVQFGAGACASEAVLDVDPLGSVHDRPSTSSLIPPRKRVSYQPGGKPGRRAGGSGSPPGRQGAPPDCLRLRSDKGECSDKTRGRGKRKMSKSGENDTGNITSKSN